MPKGYNKDGSKKVRPVNSGRKSVESKQISPQISLEAAAVLASLKKTKTNINEFISKAILEKAANDAAKKAATKKEPALEPNKPTPGQVDLVDMIQEIKLEKVVENIQEQASQEPVLTLMEEIRERQFLREEQDRQDLEEWLSMPAVETWRLTQTLLKNHKTKTRTSPLFIQIRATMPFEDFKASWRCHIETVNEKGEIVDWSRQASRFFVEEIRYSPDWKAVKIDEITTHFLLPVNNPVREPKPKAEKPKVAKPKPAPKPASSRLMDIFAVDNTELPEWLRMEKIEPTPELEPEPTPEPETEQNTLANLLLSQADETDYNPLNHL